MTESSGGRGIARRMQLWLTLGMVLANLGGAFVVFAIAFLVIPSADVPDNASVKVANAILAGVYVAVAIPVGVLWGTRRFRKVREWLRSDRPPNEQEQRLVLRGPMRLFSVITALWFAAAIVFGAVNFTYSASLGVRVAIVVALAGVSTGAIAYLVAERILRPTAARALEAGAPPKLILPGVTMRALLAWALGTGIPVLGMVFVGIAALAGEDFSKSELGLTMVGLGTVALVVGLLASIFAARANADPVRSVRSALAKVEEGDFDVQVPVYDGTQIGMLQAGFNRMVGGLRERERMRDLFGRHVGEDVAREALEREIELGGEVRDVAVLFVDVIGSTSLAEERPPEEVVELLNRFFQVVVELVEEEGGSINKFEGDAALAIFGAPVELEDREDRALRTARKLGRRLAEDVPDIQAGIGVAGGQAVAGNIGAAHRFEYTVIGDPVNQSARLSELAKEAPERVAAAAELVEAAGEEEAGHWEIGDSVTLRGRSDETRLATPREAG